MRRRSLLIAAAVLAVGAVAAEVGMRVLARSDAHGGAAAPAWSPIMQQIKLQEGMGGSEYVPHPELGALLAPNLDKRVETLDFTYTLRTDEKGFPNSPPWPESIEAAVLGNSLLLGPGVKEQERFVDLLNQRFPGRRFHNFALPGGGPEHAYRVYREYAAPLGPKLTIMTLWLTWDINNARGFQHWLERGAGSDFTDFRMNLGGAPKPGESFMRKIRETLSRSQVLQALYWGLKGAVGREDMAEEHRFAAGETVFLAKRDQLRLAAAFDSPDTPNLQAIFFDSLERLRAAVAADGGRLVVALVPCKEELYGAVAYPAVLRPYRLTRAELTRRGFSLLDFYPAFEAHGRERAPFFKRDIHPNALGNHIMAEAASAWIEAQSALAPGPR